MIVIKSIPIELEVFTSRRLSQCVGKIPYRDRADVEDQLITKGMKHSECSENVKRIISELDPNFWQDREAIFKV